MVEQAVLANDIPIRSVIVKDFVTQVKITMLKPYKYL